MTKTVFRIVPVLVVSAVFGVAVSSVSAEGLGMPNPRKIIGDVRQKVEQKQQEVRDRIRGGFCDRFAETAGTIADKLSGVRERVGNRNGDSGSAIEEGRNTRDENLTEIRSQQDARRLEWYAKLDDRATTDKRKAAVEEFKKTVDAAVETRRDAVDAAISAFRSGVDALVSGKKSSVVSVADDFQSSIDAAIATVKSDCGSGKDPEAVRTTFRTSLKAAKDKLVTERKSASGIGDRVEALAKTRNEATKKTAEAFDAALKSATEKLKAALAAGE